MIEQKATHATDIVIFRQSIDVRPVIVVRCEQRPIINVAIVSTGGVEEGERVVVILARGASQVRRLNEGWIDEWWIARMRMGE